MAPTPILLLRILAIHCLLWLCASPAYSQDDLGLWGPTQIQFECDSQAHEYILLTQLEILETRWEITSPAVIIDEKLHSSTIAFSLPGTYVLTAISLTLEGVYIVDSLIIYVFGSSGSLEVEGCYENNTGGSCYKVCAHSITTLYSGQQFTDWSVSGADSYELINSSVMQVTWGAGGSGMVTASNGICATSACFDILPLPVADFISSPGTLNDTLTVCSGQEIYFENLSLHGLTYTWNFGDGDVVNTFDASHSFEEEGFYTVTLEAASICECVSTKEMVIQVLPAAAPELDCVNSICPETRQRYTATTDGCTNFDWSVSFNGTIINGGGPADDFIEVIWHEGPEGTIELSVSGCSSDYCSMPNIFRIPIISPDGPLKGDVAVCSGELVTYSAPYFPGTQYQWQIGPAGNIEGAQNSNAITVRWHDVNVVTSTHVSVEHSNCFLACGGGDTLPVVITPEIRLNGDIQVCQDGVATILAEAGFTTPLLVAVNWHIENASGQVVYTAPGALSVFSHTFSYPAGEYWWVATNASSSYCSDVIRQKISVTATPPAPLGIKGEEEICPGQPYGFTIIENGNYSVLWVVTDGASTTTYTGQSISHIFGSTPPYIVQAFHTDIQYIGCVSTNAATINLKTAADLAIEGPSEVCFNAIDSYTIEYISGAEYAWEILPAGSGEIKKSDLNNVDVFWTQTGAATLRLHACGVVIDKEVNVNPLPAFNVTGIFAACINETVSISTDQPGLSHTWFDEDHDILSTINNTTLPPGEYAVSLRDALGCVNTEVFHISSYPAPEVILTSAYDNEYCTNIPGGVEIVANTDGSDYVFTWFKDDINIGIGGPVFNVTDFATYHVEVTNQYGCKTTSTKVKFSNCCIPADCPGGGGGPPGAVCTYILTDFDIDITGDECHIRRYTPQDSDIIPGTTDWLITTINEEVFVGIHSDILEYTYALPGYYHVYMIAQRNGFPYTPSLCGHFEKFVDTIRAVADYKFSGICAGTTIAFEDLTTFLPFESITAWSWDFDDPASGGDNTSSLQNPTHIFYAPGNYNVKLNVTMASGCSSSKIIAVHVSDGPVLMPIHDSLHCENEALAFHLAGSVFDIQWMFGDPASGAQNNAQSDSAFHTFDVPGNYNVNVSAADIFTCRSDTSFTVDIRPNTLGGDISLEPLTLLCYGDTAFLTAPNGAISWLWSTGETSQEIAVTETNQYNVLMHDQFNCTYSPPPQFVTISPKPSIIIKAREIIGPDLYGPWDTTLQLCFGTEFEIQVFSEASIQFHWSNGFTGPILSFTTEGGNLPPSGLHSFSVVGTNVATGCLSDTSTILIEIFGLPTAPMISLQSGNGCSDNANTLQVTNPQAGIEYVWSDGQEGTMIIADKSGSYFVVAIDPNGCSSQSNSLFIKPSANVDQIPGGCFLRCDPLTVCLPPLSQVSHYDVFQNGVLFQSGSTWPSDLLITQDGSYTFEITTSNGCTATSEPLDIQLYTGTGNITVITYLDTDGDGLITAADALLPNIPVQIVSSDGMHEGRTFTDGGAQFVFEDFPASGYLVSVNHALLSSQWKVIIDSLNAQIVTCDDSIVVSLLLRENCTVTGPDQFFTICPGDAITLGDSTWTDTGHFELHLTSDTGCDSLVNIIIGRPDSFLIEVYVWVDVDHDGIVSPADTVIEGITVVFDPGINQVPATGVTDEDGYASGTFDVRQYIVSVDSTLLPPGYNLIYGLDYVSDTVCGIETLHFLIEKSCQSVQLVEQHTLCPGDSLQVENTWLSDAGFYTFQVSEPGAACDTILDVYLSLLPGMMATAMTSWNCQSLGTINLTVTGVGPFDFEWSPEIEDDSIVTGLPGGIYFVTITDANGCSSVESIEIIETPLLEFDMPGLYEIHAGDSVEIIITGDTDIPGINYMWWPDSIISCANCPSTIAFPTVSTLLSVLIMDADSCFYELETFISVIPDTTSEPQDTSFNTYIYVPNVFSPNDDGVNDRFFPVSNNQEMQLKELIVFDRWGTMIYRAADIPLNTLEGWNGLFREKEMQPQVYTYFARITTPDGVEYLRKGNVTLVR